VPREPEDNVLLIFSDSEASFSKTDSGFVFQIDIYLLVFCCGAQMYYFLQNIKIILQINKKIKVLFGYGLIPYF
jgi:hypothetical protein